ncbi:MAG: hypothetical protein J0M33_27080 [Anaerolineae bacterium]|nr:hypothetical protein [Anaerolineae bacterium]
MKAVHLAIACLCLVSGSVQAQERIERIVGYIEMPYVMAGTEQPVILLVDRTESILQRDYGIPAVEERQAVGEQIAEPAGLRYWIDLPENVGQDGISIYTVELTQNYFGAPTLDPLEQRFEQGTSAWQSVVIGEAVPDILGGRVVVFSPTDGLLFPSAFGTDGLMFTSDDPMMGLPFGYSVIDLQPGGFRIEQSAEVVIDLYPIPGLLPTDLRSLGYVEAFDRLIDQLQLRYAYTDYRQIDWEALRATYRNAIPIGEDPIAYYQVLARLGESIGDLHVFAAPSPELVTLMNPELLQDISAPTPPPCLEVTLEDGFGIATFRCFSQPASTMTIWREFLQLAEHEQVTGIVIDLRYASGGDGALATMLAAHLFSPEEPLRFQDFIMSRFDQRVNAFVEVPLSGICLSFDFGYAGDAVLVIDSQCASACELFTYLLRGRAMTIGDAATAGAGGAMSVVRMPGGVNFFYTFIRATDMAGQPAWERAGISPDILYTVSQIEPSDLFALANGSS